MLTAFLKRLSDRWVKVQICWYIIIDGKHERVGQFMHNRLYRKFGQTDPYNIYDKVLLTEIKEFREQYRN